MIHSIMDVENMCLDLNKYSLDEILGLLGLPPVDKLSSTHLKDARKKVLMTHPDKSKLDGSIFRFYVEAYEAVERVVAFMDRSNTSECAYLAKHSNIDKEVESSIGKNELIKAGYITKDGKIGKNWDKFNKKFHDWFEKNGELVTNDEGYAEFLQSEDEKMPSAPGLRDAMHMLEKRRNKQMAICKYQEVQGLDSYNCSSQFSCGYGEDLRQAYTETLVPVNESDFHNRKKFGSIDQLQRARKADIRDVDYESGKKIHYQQKSEEQKQDVNRFFNEVSHLEKQISAVKQFQKDIFRIKN